MPGKTKIKIKTIKDKELADMFNQMLGAGNVNVSVCWPRYVQIRSYIERAAETLDLFNNKSKFYAVFPELANCQKEINAFIDKVKTGVVDTYNVDLSAYEGKYNEMSEEDVKKFGQLYEEFKHCDIVNALVETCDALIVHKKHIDNKEALNHKFILMMPGAEFCPFPFTKLNLKYAVSHISANAGSNNAASPLLDLILIVLNKLFSLSYNLYKLINTPDIDIDEFVEVVMRNIQEARKHIPRCNKAFDKLAKSVEMLKDNFPTYYRDFVQSSNSTIIIENFVLDVANSTKADVELMRQFRQIITHYRKVASQQVKNPQVKGLLDKINEQFSKFDKYANIKIDEKVDEDTSDDSDENPEEDAEAIRVKEIQEENAKKSVDDLVAEINAGSSKKQGKK